MWWALGLLFVCVGAFVFQTSRKYSRLFSTAHLVELAEHVADLKPMARVLDDSPVPRRVTSEGMVVLYTVIEEGAEHIHHLSLSYQRGHLAMGASTRFAAYFAGLLSVAPDKISMGRSADGHVHHIVFDLNESEQQAHDALDLKPPRRGEALALWRSLEDAVRVIRDRAEL